MQYIVTEEDRDKTLDALSSLEEGESLVVREESRPKQAITFLKIFLEELFSADTWIEARQTEYDENLERDAASQQRTTYQTE